MLDVKFKIYPTPGFPRPPAPDGSGFGRTAYMVAYTVTTGAALAGSYGLRDVLKIITSPASTPGGKTS